MRRLIAALSLVALTNLVFVQGGAACLLAMGAHHTEAASASGGMHEGHDMGALANHDMAQSTPDEGLSRAPSCVMMGPCLLTIDVSGMAVASADAEHSEGVIAGSDHLPASLASSPELPPPRA